MISLAPSTKVYLASKPVSMRLGFDGLAALVRPLFAVEPYCGSLLETAKLNDVNPQAWLADVLDRIGNGHSISRLDELLPWHWTPAQE